jgi:hypothetical protein
MSTRSVTTVRRPPPPGRLVELGWSQFVIVAIGLVGVLVALAAAVLPSWDDTHVDRAAAQRFEVEWGFQGGSMSLHDGAGSESRRWGIVRVVPGGKLARIGVKDQDVPVDAAGRAGATAAFYQALQEASGGTAGVFHVRNAADWASPTARRIDVPANTR